MIKPILAFLLAALVLGLAPWVIGEKGYILIALDNWTIEGTIVSFAIMLLLAVSSVFIIYKLVRYLLSIYGSTRFRFTERSQKKQLANLQQGLWSTLNNDHSFVMKKLDSSAIPEQWQGISYAFAADAALKSKQSAKALALLAKVPDEQQNYVAHLYAQSGEEQMAADLLSIAAEQKKPDALQLRLYSQLLVAQKDSESLLNILPKLAKFAEFTDQQWQDVWQVIFSHGDSKILQQRFEQLPRSLKSLAEVQYCQAILNNGEAAIGEKILLKLLKKGHFEAICQVLSSSQQLSLVSLQKAIQEQLKKQPESTQLLLCLAYTAKAQNDAELASKVFKTVLNDENSPRHWRAAAECYAAQGLTEQALVLYQRFTPV